MPSFLRRRYVNFALKDFVFTHELAFRLQVDLDAEFAEIAEEEARLRKIEDVSKQMRPTPDYMYETNPWDRTGVKQKKEEADYLLYVWDPC